MAFLTGEEMQARLNELGSPELSEVRRAEIITELGAQHSSGLGEMAATNQTLEDTTNKLNDSRDAMARMYTQLNAQTFGGADGKVEDPSYQETVSLEDLLNSR